MNKKVPTNDTKSVLSIIHFYCYKIFITLYEILFKRTIMHFRD